MTSSATPGAERTPPGPPAVPVPEPALAPPGPSAGRSRARRWRRSPAPDSRDIRSVVIGRGRWSEPVPATPDLEDAERAELAARRAAAATAAALATEPVVARAVAGGLTDPDPHWLPGVRPWSHLGTGPFSPETARPVADRATTAADDDAPGRDEEEARRRARLAADATAAHAARAEAEQAALCAALEREAAEARALAHAEAAARAQEERSAAEARARELAASLEEARAALLEQTRATLTPRPDPAAPAVEPDGVPDLVELHSPGSSVVITMLLGVGALAAAGVSVYEAYLDRLTTPPGIAASVVTLLLALVVGRARGAGHRLWLERGVLHVEEGDTHRRFDLTSPQTKVEMIGLPGAKRWKVLFLRKGMPAYEVNAGMVEPEAFVAALRPYRPHL